MNFEITQVNERLVNGKVTSVQVHYKLQGDDHLSSHNGYVTLDERVDNLDQVVIEKLIEQVNSINAE